MSHQIFNFMDGMSCPKRRVKYLNFCKIILVVSSVLLLMNYSEKTFAESSAYIEAGFKDKGLYECVVRAFNKDNNASKTVDDILTSDELKKIMKLGCTNSSSGNKIIDATGIEKMTELTELNLSYNKLTSIDLSKNTKLTSLFLLDNTGMSTIDVSKNLDLSLLMMGYNGLESLDISHNTKLTRLEVFNGKLASLDVSNNINLTKLDIGYNKINQESLVGLEKLSNLTSLDIRGNKFTSLDVKNNKALKQLNLNGNELTYLDVRYNSSLEDLTIDKDVLIYANINELVDDDKTQFDLSKLRFIVDGSHRRGGMFGGEEVTFLIEETESLSYDKENMILTIDSLEGNDEFFQVTGSKSYFSYKILLIDAGDLDEHDDTIGPSILDGEDYGNNDDKILVPDTGHSVSSEVGISVNAIFAQIAFFLSVGTIISIYIVRLNKKHKVQFRHIK